MKQKKKRKRKDSAIVAIFPQKRYNVQYLHVQYKFNHYK